MTRPRVSMMVPAYNAAEWLPMTLDSALAQDFRDYELVVLDNASTDGTAAVLARYRDPRLSWRVNAANIGFPGNVALACEQARGDFLVVLNADDILHPGYLSAAVAFLDAEPSASMVHGPTAWIDAQGRRIPGGDAGWARLTPGPRAMLDAFALGFCFSAMMMRMEAVRGAGPCDPAWGNLVDLWLIERMCLQGDIGYLDRVLCDYRVHETSMSTPLYRSNSFFRRQLAAARACFAWPEAIASGASAQLPEAERHVARIAVEVLHLARADGYGAWARNLTEILREAPGVALRPETWARIAFGALPLPAIEALTRRRRARARRAIEAPA